MICVNCGKDTPTLGRVCPYCGASKAESAANEAWGLRIALLLFVVFVIFNMIKEMTTK